MLQYLPLLVLSPSLEGGSNTCMEPPSTWALVNALFPKGSQVYVQRRPTIYYHKILSFPRDIRNIFKLNIYIFFKYCLGAHYSHLLVFRLAFFPQHSQFRFLGFAKRPGFSELWYYEHVLFTNIVKGDKNGAFRIDPNWQREILTMCGDFQWSWECLQLH